jgi:hypothetical protein
MHQFRLVRGNVPLGVVTHAPDERIDGSPWDIGAFEPSPDFESVRPLFEQEQRLLDESVRTEDPPASDRLLESASGLQRQILQPGVCLVSLADGRRLDVEELHIEAGRIFWR